MPISVAQRWLALPGNVRGALWLLGSAAGFSVMNALIKGLGQDLGASQLVFFRSAIGLLVLLPFLLRSGGSVWRASRPGMHLLRGLLGLAAMFSTFYALTLLPLAAAVAIFFAKPLFTMVLAVPLLGETVGWRRWAAAAAGFAGVLVMLRPGAGDPDPAMLVALAGALLMALVMIVIKKMTATERPMTMLMYFTLIATLGSLPAALTEWRTPDGGQLGLLLALGAVASLSQYMLVRAYRAGEAAAISPMDYSQLVFAGVIGVLWFGELPDGNTLFGAAVIAGASLYVVRREARAARRQPSAPDDEKAAV